MARKKQEQGVTSDRVGRERWEWTRSGGESYGVLGGTGSDSDGGGMGFFLFLIIGRDGIRRRAVRRDTK